MSKRMETDRRKSQRYALREDVFLVLRPFYDNLVKVKDISNGGVGFEYPAFAEQAEVVDPVVDIFATTPAYFRLVCLPCSVVFDISVGKSTLGGVTTRRCGLKFGKLSRQHKRLLEVMLKDFTSHPLPVEP